MLTAVLLWIEKLQWNKRNGVEFRKYVTTKENRTEMGYEYPVQKRLEKIYLMVSTFVADKAIGRLLD